MHPLIRLALWTCPLDFRASYGQSIAEDAAERRVSPLGVAFDLVYQGMAMRAEGIARDVVYGARTLARAPMYTTVAALAIALAIAANVAVVAVLEGVLLRPLPYPNADRIALVTSGAPDLRNAPFSFLDAQDVGAQSGNDLQAFGIASSNATATMTGIARPITLLGNDVDAGYFSVLGAHAEVGRVFTPADLGTRSVIVSDRIWRTYFGANPGVIGTVVQLDGANYTIIGVMPDQFRDVAPDGVIQRDFWKPIDSRSSDVQFRGTVSYNAWALVKPGVSFASAQADVARVMNGIIQKYQVEHPGTWDPPQVRPALQTIVAPVKTMLWLLWAIVVLLLVIACANVTNLTLARATARRSEFTIRGALGASRGRLATQLCWEMSLLSAIGGVVGIALGWLALQAFSGAASRIMPRWESVSVDFVVVGYVIAVLVLTTIATGVVPALASRRDLVSGLKAAGRSGSGDAGATKVLRSSLVIAEIALALAVVLSAGLVVRSFVALMQVPVGFNSQNLYAADVPGLPRSRYRNHTMALLAVDQLAAQLRSIPGVTGVGVTSSPPFLNEANTATIIPGSSSALPVDVNVVSAGYFQTMGIPLLRGRDFDDRDRFESQQVAIVSATFARRFFGTLDVIGKTYDPQIGWADREIRTIIGVASDTRNSLHAPSAPLQYLAADQVPGFFGFFAIRTNGDSPQLTQAIAAAYEKVDPQFPAPNVKSYQQIFSKDTGNAQAAAMLFGVLASLALLLALAGTYALTSYGVEQRTRELGIRKALGANDEAIITNILIGTLRVSCLGIGIGIVVAALCARLLMPILFQTSPFDPVTFVGVAALVTVCSVFAALVPAIRATRVHPAVALRYE